MTDDWIPLTDAHVVDALDSADVVEGYHDGMANEPRPGPNRPAGYRHGWRVGQADGGHRQPDQWDMELIRNMREAKLGAFKPGLLAASQEPTMADDTPDPCTDDAIAQGCTCRLDGHQSDPDTSVRRDRDCPLHGVDPDYALEAMRDAEIDHG